MIRTAWRIDRTAWKTANGLVRARVSKDGLDPRAGRAVLAANGNLTTAAYRKLTGSPLAPRGEGSRVVAPGSIRERRLGVGSRLRRPAGPSMIADSVLHRRAPAAPTAR